MSEKKIDPADGAAYTLDELTAFYKGTMKKKALMKYWENDCTPVKGKKGKAKAKAKATTAPPAAGEKKKDPADGKAYTFDELAAFYKGSMKKAAFMKYWENDCTPVKGKKGKAKAAPEPVVEKKTDPAYPGKAYTFDELLAAYKGIYNKKALKAYWETDCKPTKAAAKAKAKAKAAAKTEEVEEKRVDAAYGTAYTFKEMLAAYKGVYNKKACKDYWETCKPVKAKKGKAKAKAAAPAPTAPEGKRKDPADGKVYTFEKMIEVYKEKLGKAFKKKGLLKYWEEKCTPAGKKGKAAAKAAPDVEEKRVDPAYKTAYTFKELLAAYKGTYNKKACAEYWETLKPAKAKKAKGEGKAKAKAKSAPAPAAESPKGKKKDPEDGKVYTFDKLVEVYKEKLGKKFKKKALLKYWEEKMEGKPGKGGGKKANGKDKPSKGGGKGKGKKKKKGEKNYKEKETAN